MSLKRYNELINKRKNIWLNLDEYEELRGISIELYIKGIIKEIE